MTLTDQDIIRLYKEKDEKAIEETDKKYHRYCMSVAMNILHSIESSEECVNDTWLRAWNSIEKHDPNNLRTFLGKITRNLALNRLLKDTAIKRGGTEYHVILSEVEGCLPDTNNNPSSIIDTIAISDCINNFLSAQNTDNQKIFVKRYWYMESVESIANELQCTKSKVKMALLRMRKRLRVELVSAGITI